MSPYRCLAYDHRRKSLIMLSASMVHKGFREIRVNERIAPIAVDLEGADILDTVKNIVQKDPSIITSLAYVPTNMHNSMCVAYYVVFKTSPSEYSIYHSAVTDEGAVKPLYTEHLLSRCLVDALNDYARFNNIQPVMEF